MSNVQQRKSFESETKSDLASVTKSPEIQQATVTKSPEIQQGSSQISIQMPIEPEPVKSRGYSKILKSIISLFISVTTKIIAKVFSILGAVVLLPLLLLSFLVARILQLFSHNEDYCDRLAQLKRLTRGLMSLCVEALIIGLAVFYPLAYDAPCLKHVIIGGLILTSWVKIGLILCGLYFLSYVLALLPYMAQFSILRSQQTSSNAVEALNELTDCFVLQWVVLEIMKRVPKIRHQKLLGLGIDRWIQVPLLVLMGCDVITLFSHYIVWRLHKFLYEKLDPGVDSKSKHYKFVEKVLRRKYIAYCAKRVRSSVCFILSTTLVFLVWTLYFGWHSRLSETHVLEFGKWTCLSLMILSLVWLIKTIVLLVWEAHAIYERLGPEILLVGKQIFFLGIINRHHCDIFNLRYETNATTTSQDDTFFSHFASNTPFADMLLRLLRDNLQLDLIAKGDRKNENIDDSNNEKGKVDQTSRKLKGLNLTIQMAFLHEEMSMREFDFCKLDMEDKWGNIDKEKQNVVWRLSSRNRVKFKRELVLNEDRPATLFDVERVAQHLLTTKDALSKQMHISQVLHLLNTDAPSNIKGRSFKDKLEHLIDGQNHEDHLEPKKKKTRHRDFECLLGLEDFPDEISSQNLETWMEKSRNNCTVVANRIASSKEASDTLNKLTSWVLVGAIFIMWLQLTGLATLKVLVLLASPLIAGTFIFGDTCKSLFQGIMFVYVVHPIDVADLCVIENKLMEVKSIGVWRTIFSKIDKAGSREEVTYPNSELATKAIINHKTEFDCNEYVEFNFVSSNDKDIEDLISHIESYLEGRNAKLRGKYYGITVLPTEDKTDTKMAVRFEHNMELKRKTYFECFIEKEKLRSEFIIYVKRLLNEIESNCEKKQ